MSPGSKNNRRLDPQFGYDGYRRREPYLEDRRPAAPLARRRSLIPIFLVGAVTILFGGFLWISYTQAPKHPEGQLPVIIADTTPAKVKPDIPGGADTPLQDTTVYDDLNQKKTHKTTEVEHLLQPPEQPLPMPAPAVNEAAPDAPQKPGNTDQLSSSIPAPTPTPSSAPQQVSPSKEMDIDTDDEAALAPAPTPTTNNNLLPVPPPKNAGKPTIKTPTIVSPQSAAPQSTPGTMTIQLGAFRDLESANAEWKRLQSRYADQLSDLSSKIQRVDLGEKGVWYRLKAGPLNGDEAKADCTSLKAENVPCIVSH